MHFFIPFPGNSDVIFDEGAHSTSETTMVVQRKPQKKNRARRAGPVVLHRAFTGRLYRGMEQPAGAPSVARLPRKTDALVSLVKANVRVGEARIPKTAAAGKRVGCRKR